MVNWMEFELDRMLILGIRWEVIIKVNPDMINSEAYSYYHNNKYISKY